MKQISAVIWDHFKQYPEAGQVTLISVGVIIAFALWGGVCLVKGFRQVRVEGKSLRGDGEPLAGSILEQWHALGKAANEKHLAVAASDLEELAIDRLAMWDPQIRFIIGSLTALGLLGTFVGMAMAVWSVSNVIQGVEGFELKHLQQMTHDLRQPIGGMSVALFAGIFGVGGAVVLGLAFSILQTKRLSQVHRLMLHAHQDIIPAYAPMTPDLQIDLAFKDLQTGVGGVMQQFAQDMGQRMLQMQEDTATRQAELLERVGKEMGQVRTALEDLARGFNQDVHQLGQDMASYHTRIEENLVAFGKGVKALKNVAPLMEKASEDLHKSVGELSQGMQPYRDLLQQLDLWHEAVGQATGTMVALSQDMQRTQFFQNLNTQLLSLNHLGHGQLEELKALRQDLIAEAGVDFGRKAAPPKAKPFAEPTAPGREWWSTSTQSAAEAPWPPASRAAATLRPISNQAEATQAMDELDNPSSLTPESSLEGEAPYARSGTIPSWGKVRTNPSKTLTSIWGSLRGKVQSLSKKIKD